MGVLLFLIGLVYFSALEAKMIHVPYQKQTIQSAINCAVDEDTILVDHGVYFENINFKGKAITVASYYLYDHHPINTIKTIIDGSKPQNPDSSSVVYFISGEDSCSALVGFTIRGGTGTLIKREDKNYRLGGGIYCEQSAATIIGNIIRNNNLFIEGKSFGGGICVWQYSNYKPIFIKKNVFEANSIKGYFGAFGGAIFLRGPGQIEHNLIKSNQCFSQDDWAKGGGIHLGYHYPERNIRVQYNEIHNNTAISNRVQSGKGGGLFVEGSGEAYNISNNSFYGCEASHFGGAIYCEKNASLFTNDRITYCSAPFGGAISMESSSGQFDNCILSNNVAEDYGGAIDIFNESNPSLRNNLITSNQARRGAGLSCALLSNPYILNCTISKNKAIETGGGLHCESTSNPKIRNSIIYENVVNGHKEQLGNQIFLYDSNSDPQIIYSCLEGGKEQIAGFGAGSNYQGLYNKNIAIKPDYSLNHLSPYLLSSKSPCVDAGDPDISDLSKLDLRGRKRLTDGNGDYITRVDIGAYESEPVSELSVSKPNSNSITLHPNFPNPFNSSTTISYTLLQQTQIEIRIYNILGQQVFHKTTQLQQAGTHKFYWNAGQYASGVYFLRLNAFNQNFHKTVIQKLVLKK